jgi:hypothetical protein
MVIMRTCIATVAAVTALVLTYVLVHTSPVDSSPCRVGTNCGGDAPSPRVPDAQQDPCDGAACGPGSCTVVGNGSTAASPSRRTRSRSTHSGAPTNGAAEVHCDCPDGYSSKVLVGDNGTTTVSCEANACTHIRSSLLDPVASHTIQWAGDVKYSHHDNIPHCGHVRSFERCQYYCDPGYQPTGDALCLSNGTIVGGGCTPVRCAPLAIPHSDRARGNECTGFTGDECNFTCANGYRRADQPQTTSGVAPPTQTSPLLCSPLTQTFVSNFAFAVGGMNASAYNGIYLMTNRTCRGQPIWQHDDGTGIDDDGPVLYSRSQGGFGHGLDTAWYIGPAARAVDCSDMNALTHAWMSTTACTSIRRSGAMQRVPDDVACNPPVSTWSEVVQTCEGRDPSNCRCSTGFDYSTCFFYNNELSVERTTAGIDDDGSGDGQEQQLCVPLRVD